MGGRATYFGEKRGEPGVQRQRPCDFLDTVDNCGVVPVSQQKADLFESQPGVLSEQKHCSMTRLGDRPCAALPGECWNRYTVLIGYCLQDRVGLSGLGRRWFKSR